MSARRWQPAIVLLLGLVVIAALAALLAVPPVDQLDPSSRSSGRLGTLALYTWLNRLGLPVSRLSGTFDLRGSDLLVEYDPSVAFSAQEVDSVGALVAQGGDVLLCVAPESVEPAAPLLQRWGIQPGPPAPAGSAAPAQPFDVAGRVHAVPVSAGLTLVPVPALVPLLVHDGQVVAGVIRQPGAGRVYVLADTAPLSNDGLRHGDSAVFVLALLERARGGHVVFDEYHHGERSGAAGGAAAIFDGPMGVAAVLAALILLAFLALNGRRLGQPQDPAGAAPPGTAAYLAAMAQLITRSPDRGLVAARYADELKRFVGRRTGVDHRLADSAFADALRAAGHGRAAAVEALLERCRALAAGRPDAHTLVQMARDVAQLEADWSGGPSPGVATAQLPA